MTERKRIDWTAEDRARHRAIREQFKNQPSIDQLIAAALRDYAVNLVST
jgi:hypothetical protein